MKLRIAVVLAQVVLFGCGSGPDSGKIDREAANADRDARLEVAQQGYFTDLEEFTGDVGVREIATDLARLNGRYDQIITPHVELLKGARIADFGSYDGRWAYAALDAGAAHVTGIEVDQSFNDKAQKNLEELGVSSDRYTLIVADVLEELRKTEPGTYDGIICAGLYYHITYHVELMSELKRIGVKWIIMDSAVDSSEEPIIKWVESPYGVGIEGTPSVPAIEMIADAVGFEHERVPVTQKGNPGIWDYEFGNRVTITITAPEAL